MRDKEDRIVTYEKSNMDINKRIRDLMVAWKIGIGKPTYLFSKFPVKERYISNSNSKLKSFDSPY